MGLLLVLGFSGTEYSDTLNVRTVSMAKKPAVRLNSSVKRCRLQPHGSFD
jgi:hypothetical protein